jgi:predicted enzyme related to lactoylglutathione lyase
MAAKKKAKKAFTSARAAKASKPASGSGSRAKKRAAKRAPAKKARAKRSTAARAKVASTPAIVHWEIQAQDAKKIQQFYADLFGWKIDAANPMNYGMVSSKGKGGIDGGIGGTMSGHSRLLVYATVADINGVLEKAESLGAKTILPRTDVGPVIMGIFEDVEGNHFGIIEE